MDFNSVLGIVGIVLAIAVYSVCMWKGFNQFLSVFAAVFVVAITNGLPLWESFSTMWMQGFTGYIAGYVLLTILGAVYSVILTKSGATETIALAVIKIAPHRPHIVFGLLCVLLACFGINPWTSLFFIAPITFTIFKKMNIPRRFAPAYLYFNCMTLAFCMPFTLNNNNLFPANILGTSLGAGWTVGLICEAVMFILGMLAMDFMVKKAQKNGETFVAKEGDNLADFDAEVQKKRPNLLLSILPMIATIIVANLSDTLGTPRELGLIVGIVLALIIYIPYGVKIKDFPSDFATAAPMGVNLTLALGTVYGFGVVIAQTGAFSLLAKLAMSIPGGSLVSAAVAVNVLAGVTGSGSNGINLVLPTLGPSYLASGVAPAALARVCSIGSLAFDSLPHNSAVVGLMCTGLKETHKTAYMPLFWMTVVVPLIGTFLAVVLFTVFPGLAAI